ASVLPVSNDPVSPGLVASLARPSGNLSGVNLFIDEMVGERLELLRELVPGAIRVAVLVNPSNSAASESVTRDAEVAALTMGLQIRVLNATTSREIDAAFASFMHERPDALFVSPDPLFNDRRVQFAPLAAHPSLSATYSGRNFSEAGGAVDTRSEIGKRLGVVGRI